MNGKELKINNAECSRCMHCITRMTKALKPTGERGATICIGSKAQSLSAHSFMVIVPFIKVEPPYTEVKDLIRKIWEWWDEERKARERIGEVIEMKGMRSFLEGIGQTPIPQQIKEPRKDPFMFYTRMIWLPSRRRK